MPTTRENVAFIHQRNPKYSPAEILEILNEVHLRCVEQDLDQFLYIDPLTGMPPYLITHTGVHVYDAPENCRKTAKIAVHASAGLLDTGEYRYYSRHDWENFLEGDMFKWCGREFYKVAAVTQVDALEGAEIAAKIIFGSRHNPGETTHKYHHFYWIKANQLLDLDDQMQLPDSLHFMIRRAVSAYMSTEDYGESNTDEQAIQKILKDVRYLLSSGASGRPTTVAMRIEDRDF